MMTGLMSNPLLFLAILFVAIAVFCIVVVVLQSVLKDQIAVEKRVNKLSLSSGIDLVDASNGVQKADNSNPLGFIFNSVAKLSYTATLKEKMQKGGMTNIKPEEFLTLKVVLVVFPALLVLLFTGTPIPALAVAVLMFIAPIIYLNRKIKKRKNQFDQQLADALMMISNSLKGGLSFPQAMEGIARDMPEPISLEFDRVVREIQFGKTQDQAITDMMNRVDSADLMIAMNAVLIQHQVGGNLADILDTIASTIKDRISIKKEINAITAQGRMSGLIISLLPAAIFAFTMIAAPSYSGVFLTDFRAMIALAVGAFMEITGYIVMNKVIEVKY